MTGTRPWPCQAPSSTPSSSKDPVTSLLFSREVDAGKRPSAARRAAAVFDQRLPALVQEREVPYDKVSQFDKAFTAAWVSHDEVALGTKCNHLVNLNVNTHAIRTIPLPHNPYRRDGDPHCGMHAISVNHSCDMIAAGGSDPKDVTVFSLPSYKPVQTLMAHQDWIFGLAWITDCHIATGSRDKTINLWKVEEGSLAINPYPLTHSDMHRGKVRDLRFSLNVGRLASLSSDGTLKVWDPNLDLLQSYIMPCPEELVALAMHNHLLAAGSKDFVTLLDVRSNQTLANIELQGLDACGVRCLSFNRDIITCGGASGHILFYDMRAGKFMPCGTAQPNTSQLLQPPTAAPTAAAPQQPTQNGHHTNSASTSNGPSHHTANGHANSASNGANGAWSLSAFANGASNGNGAPNINGGMGTNGGEVVQVWSAQAAAGVPSGANGHAATANGHGGVPQNGHAYVHVQARNGLNGVHGAAHGGHSTACCSGARLLGRGAGCGKHGAQRWFRETGNGWFNEEDRLYRTLLQGQKVRMACYSVCWDVFGGKFFCCGGPLAVGLKGCYMSMWE